MPCRPEKIKCGEDIVLHPGFAISEDGQAKPTLQRQRSILSKVHKYSILILLDMLSIACRI